MSGMDRPPHTTAGTAADTTARLVALGRDREAALLHARPESGHDHDPHPARDQGATVEVNQQLDVVLPTLIGLARTVTPDQLERPTPCADFTVEGVFAHMIAGAGLFA